MPPERCGGSKPGVRCVQLKHIWFPQFLGKLSRLFAWLVEKRDHLTPSGFSIYRPFPKFAWRIGDLPENRGVRRRRVPRKGSPKGNHSWSRFQHLVNPTKHLQWLYRCFQIHRQWAGWQWGLLSRWWFSQLFLVVGYVIYRFLEGIFFDSQMDTLSWLYGDFCPCFLEDWNFGATVIVSWCCCSGCFLGPVLLLVALFRDDSSTKHLNIKSFPPSYLMVCAWRYIFLFGAGARCSWWWNVCVASRKLK